MVIFIIRVLLLSTGILLSLFGILLLVGVHMQLCAGLLSQHPQIQPPEVTERLVKLSFANS